MSKLDLTFGEAMLLDEALAQATSRAQSIGKFYKPSKKKMKTKAEGMQALRHRLRTEVIVQLQFKEEVK